MYLQFIVVLIILAENHGIYSGKWLISLRSLSGFKIPHESFSGPLWGSTIRQYRRHHQVHHQLEPEDGSPLIMSQSTSCY